MKRGWQKPWVIEQLKARGEISRNTCLGHYPAISRLGAIICTLKEEGWEFTPSRREGDYVYKTAVAPKKKMTVMEVELRDGRPVAVPRVVMV